MNKIVLTIFLLYIFGYYFFSSFIIESLLLLAILISGVYLIKKNKLKIMIEDYFIIILIFIFLIGSFYSSDILKGFRYLIILFVGFIIKIIIQNLLISSDYIIKLTKVLILILILFIILHPVFTQQISTIRNYFTTDFELIYVNDSNIRQGLYSGIFPDRAVSAFVASLGIFIGYIEIRNKKSPLGLLYIIISLVALILTGKRGPLFATIISLVLIQFTISKNLRKLFGYMLGSAIIFVVLFFLLSNFEFAQSMFDRIFDNENFFTYRLEIYGQLLNDIVKKPIFGYGTGSTNNDIGILGHNIYLNILRENGIVGFLILIQIIIIIFFKINKNKNIYLISNNDVYFILVFYYFCLYGLSGNPLYDNYIIIYTLMTLGAINIKENNNEKNRNINISQS